MKQNSIAKWINNLFAPRWTKQPRNRRGQFSLVESRVTYYSQLRESCK